MKILIKAMIKLLYNCITSKKEREFNRLVTKYGITERFITRHNVNFLNYTFDVLISKALSGRLKRGLVVRDTAFHKMGDQLL
jgi:hypothetical protein